MSSTTKIVIAVVAAVIIVGVIWWFFSSPRQSSAGRRFSATLSGNNVVPPNPTSATGNASALLNGPALGYNITISGLPTVASAGIYNAAAGQNGSIVKTLTFTDTADPLTKVSSGVWNNLDASEPLTPEILTLLTSSQLYVQVSSAGTPAAIIRGQLIPLVT